MLRDPVEMGQTVQTGRKTARADARSRGRGQNAFVERELGDDRSQRCQSSCCTDLRKRVCKTGAPTHCADCVLAQPPAALAGAMLLTG